MKSGKADAGKKTIMIVDDDESMRMLMQSVLEKDYNIITKTDGQEALMYLKGSIYPDLILLDMEMPNLNGRVFIRRVKSGHKGISDIPIILITSVDTESLIKSSFKNGVSAYIKKPFNPEELVNKVTELMHQEKHEHHHHGHH